MGYIMVLLDPLLDHLLEQYIRSPVVIMGQKVVKKWVKSDILDHFWGTPFYGVKSGVVLLYYIYERGRVFWVYLEIYGNSVKKGSKNG